MIPLAAAATPVLSGVIPGMFDSSTELSPTTQQQWTDAANTLRTQWGIDQDFSQEPQIIINPESFPADTGGIIKLGVIVVAGLTAFYMLRKGRK